MPKRSYKILGLLMRYRKMEGFMVMEFSKGIVIFQPNNGIYGSYVLIPDKGPPSVGSKTEIMRLARELDAQKPPPKKRTRPKKSATRK